jgi:hypothetical protein
MAYTFLLAVATVFTAVILLTTDFTLHKTLFASNRAWITPRYMKMTTPLEVGKESSLLFVFGNGDKEPAIKVGRHDDSKSISMKSYLAGTIPGTALVAFRDAIEAAGIAVPPAAAA